MKPVGKFVLNPSSRVLIPDAPGVRTLLDGLRNGGSIRACQSEKHPITLQDTDEPWLFCETSGTSGLPKMIRRRPASWIKSFDVNADRFSISSNDTYATFGSLGHSLTLFATVEALSLGADICPLMRLNPRQQVRHLAELGVSLIYATPTQLNLILRGAKAARIATLPKVRHVFSGGGKLEKEVQLALCSLFPSALIHEFYGASETSFITISDGTTPKDSVGLPYPGVSVRIGTTTPARPTETGDIWVSSPYLFDGYVPDQPHGAKWDGAYLNVGDIGFLDEHGYLFLRGRKNRMVTVADKNVFPEEIEDLVAQMDGVEVCAVLAVPDQTRGHKLICFAQTSGADLRSEVIRDHCRKWLSAHSVPHQVTCVNKLPLLASGKPDLRALSAMQEDC